MKRILCSAWVMFGLFAAADARAQAPPPPSATVLAYYDGTPELATIYSEALAGFADEADYYLPVVQTADPVAFGDAVAAGDYDVFVAVTSDAAAAIQWTATVSEPCAGTLSNFAAFYPDPNGQSEIGMKFVFQKELVSPLPPSSAPNGCWFWDITNDVLGGPQGLPLLDGPGGPIWDTADILVPWWLQILGIDSDDLKDFQNWVQARLNEARNLAADALEELANYLDGLGDTEVQFEVGVELTMSVTGPEVKVTMKVTGTTTAADAATLARRLANKLRTGGGSGGSW